MSSTTTTKFWWEDPPNVTLLTMSCLMVPNFISTGSINLSSASPLT